VTESSAAPVRAAFLVMDHVPSIENGAISSLMSSASLAKEYLYVNCPWKPNFQQWPHARLVKTDFQPLR
jgi:hypothetical protein